MPQSLSLVVVHVIFSTKGRAPVLAVETRARTHAYLAEVARNLGCECYEVGGVNDHVHLAIRLSRTITIASLVEKLKSTSSRWIKNISPELRRFGWQNGYGCFSVSPPDVDALRKYIREQERHHKKSSFQDEFRMFLKKYGVKYDEAFLGLTGSGFQPSDRYARANPGLRNFRSSSENRCTLGWDHGAPSALSAGCNPAETAPNSPNTIAITSRRIALRRITPRHITASHHVQLATSVSRRSSALRAEGPPSSQPRAQRFRSTSETAEP
jgi:putative transposase